MIFSQTIEHYGKDTLGNTVLTSSTIATRSIKLTNDFLISTIGTTSLSGNTLSQIFTTYNIIPESASEIDLVTAYRIRQLICPTSTDIEIQMQEEAKVARIAKWAMEIRMQVLEGKSPSATDIATANIITTQMLAINAQIETIRTEGTSYKTTNGLI